MPAANHQALLPEQITQHPATGKGILGGHPKAVLPQIW